MTPTDQIGKLSLSKIGSVKVTGQDSKLIIVHVCREHESLLKVPFNFSIVAKNWGLYDDINYNNF